MTKTILVKQLPEKEVPTEVLADSIVALAEGIRKLRAGRLNDRALLILIQNAAPADRGAKISQSDIKRVFDGIESLEATYLKKKAISK